MNEERITPMPTSEFLTVRELAKYLRISSTSVYRLVERRDLPFYRMSQKLLFNLTDVEAYVKKCRTEAFEEPVARRKPNPVQ